MNYVEACRRNVVGGIGAGDESRQDPEEFYERAARSVVLSAMVPDPEVGDAPEELPGETGQPAADARSDVTDLEEAVVLKATPGFGARTLGSGAELVAKPFRRVVDVVGWPEVVRRARLSGSKWC